jgi:tetratricopeptide (TPR) repeat protein
MALAGLLLFVAGLCLGPMQESDLFFRLASGEQFLRTGHLVHENLFSFTFPAAPYLDSAWLFDVGAALVYRVGGFPAVVIAKTLAVLGIAALAFRGCRQQGASQFATAFVLGVAFWCLRERLVERPHVFSLLGDMVVLGCLPSIEKNERRAWLLVLAVVLWANLHAGAFLAAALLSLAAAGAAADRLGKGPCARLAFLAALSSLALLVTPVGTGTFRYLTFHVGIFDLHPVDEFRSLTWRSDFPFILFVLGAAVALVLSRSTPWRRLLPAAGLIVLAISHVRFSADAAIVLAVVAAPAFSTLVTRLAPHERSTSLALFVAFALATIVPRAADAARGGRFVDIRLDKSALPLDALHFVEEHGLRDRMYNDFETGSYLLWQGYPRYHVFVDPRLPAYPAKFHRLLGRMDISRDEWTAAMDNLGVTSALLDYAGINRRTSYWDPQPWALVFRAKNARVFVRRLPRWNALIAAYEIPATFDFTVESGTITQAILTPPPLSPVSACEWQIRVGDLYFDLDNAQSQRAVAAYRAALAFPAGCLSPEHERSAAAWIGSLDTSAGHFAEALPLLDRALAVAPDDAPVLAQRALALAGLGRASEARDTWKRAAALAGDSELGRRAKAMSTAP